MFDESFYVALSFFTVIGFFLYLGLPKKLLGALDAKRDEIKDELDSAKKLREEAEDLLSQYEAKRNAAEQQAEQIVADARENAERLAAEAKDKIAAQLERRTQQAEEKIARAEAAVIKEVRSAVTNVAIAAASGLIEQNLTDERSEQLLKKDISSLSSLL